jgi:hypothetical protein
LDREPVPTSLENALAGCPRLVSRGRNLRRSGSALQIHTFESRSDP